MPPHCALFFCYVSVSERLMQKRLGPKESINVHDFFVIAPDLIYLLKSLCFFLLLL